MNKRQIKKKRTLPKFKERAVVNVHAKHITPGSHVDIYIDKRFEGDKESGDRGFYNEIQDKLISANKALKKGFDYLASLDNGKDLFLTLWVSDTNKSYYVIRNKEEIA